MRPRAREVGLRIGQLPPGKQNTITDVPGVLVGHVTKIAGEGPLVPGIGPVRTGVTVILPHEGNLFREKVPGAIFTLNGFGKPLGIAQVAELGRIETPIALTNTLAVPRVADGLIDHALRQNPDIGVTTSTVNPLVFECSDAWLNDIQGRHVTPADVLEAIDRAQRPSLDEGNVGAGTGMMLFGFKGGIGTASRCLPAELGGYTIGALVLGNFGRKEQLRIAGVPIGMLLSNQQADKQPEERGSVIVVLATDAPLLDRELSRIARRGALGLARTGAIGGHGSGDFIVAFSTALRFAHMSAESRTVTVTILREDPRVMDALFQATIEATEEAVINALFRAETMTGRDWHTAQALPLDETLALLRQAGVIA
ncbi:MAG: P1 family peptidase [Thermorudis peleae]|nr:P1 family peptidase [Thermorudis peleae]